MKTIEVPDELADEIASRGAELRSYIIEATRQRLSQDPSKAPQSFGDLVRSGWTPPTVKGKPRADGRSWSEIEAPCEPE
jgi:hypothetical protein